MLLGHKLKWDLNFDDARRTAVLYKNWMDDDSFVSRSSSHNFQSLTVKPRLVRVPTN
ncbi:hypothetical protein LKM2_2711 [Leptospira kirschneri serovar Mozdok]|nr:hypothetical protein [Leptospira kirschneri serovar Mozdok]